MGLPLLLLVIHWAIAKSSSGILTDIEPRRCIKNLILLTVESAFYDGRESRLTTKVFRGLPARR